MKERVEEFEKQFTCLGEGIKKYVTSKVPIEKEATAIDKNGEEITKNMSYRLQFTASARFIVEFLSEGIHKIRCKYGHNDKECETCRIKCTYYDCFLE